MNDSQSLITVPQLVVPHHGEHLAAARIDIYVAGCTSREWQAAVLAHAEWLLQPLD